jgi:hypothetical protein
MSAVREPVHRSPTDPLGYRSQSGAHPRGHAIGRSIRLCGQRLARMYGLVALRASARPCLAVDGWGWAALARGRAPSVDARWHSCTRSRHLHPAALSPSRAKRQRPARFGRAPCWVSLWWHHCLAKAVDCGCGFGMSPSYSPGHWEVPVSVIAQQFARPHDPLGRLIGRGMARRIDPGDRGAEC